MSRKNSICLALALLVGISVQLVGRPASAAKALVNIAYSRHVLPAQLTIYSWAGSGTATVGTGATPSVMWPSSVIAGSSSFTNSGAYTVSNNSQRAWYNRAGTIAKSHGLAASPTKTFLTVGITTTKMLPFPTGGGATAYTAMCNAGSGMVDTNLLPPPGPTVPCCTGTRAPSCMAMGSTFMASANSGLTTICFTLNPYPAIPSGFPGSCTPRPGTLRRTPGSKKYGGTAQILRTQHSFGQWAPVGPFGNRAFSASVGGNLPGGRPASHLAPSAVGRVVHEATLHYTHTGGGTTSDAHAMLTTVPFTTGMVSVVNVAAYQTNFRRSGSNNLNPGNLTGTISVVRPLVVNSFQRLGPGLVGGGNVSYGGIETMKLTFLPEPSMALMLGCGGLALAGLARLRKR